MNRPHDGTDETLNMAAKVRFHDRPIFDFDAIFLSTADQRSRIEFGSIIQMQQIGNTSNWPGDIQTALREPVFLWQHCMRQHHCYRQDRRRIERNIETHDCPAGDVDGQTQPGTTDWLAVFVDDHYVDQRMVNLYALKGQQDI